MIDRTARIHPSADIESDVSIGPRTSIWHGAAIRNGARIGSECIIGRDAFIDEGVRIGDRVKVQNAALVYHGVTVEDGVFIGPNAILTNDRYPRAITSSGELARADDWQVGPIVLRYGCSIGAGAIVVAGVEVGRFATIGAGSVVSRTVPPHALMVGSPARRIGWVCACGSRLDGVHHDRAEEDHVAARLGCSSCGRAYASGPGAKELVEQGGPKMVDRA